MLQLIRMAKMNTGVMNTGGDEHWGDEHWGDEHWGDEHWSNPRSKFIKLNLHSLQIIPSWHLYIS